MVLRVPDIANVALALFASGKTVGINDFHKALGHPTEDTTRRTGKLYGLKLSGTMNPCVDCGEVKSQQQNMNKDAEGGSQIPGEHLFIDISLIKKKGWEDQIIWCWT
jgi:hypothetical protein